VRTKPRPKPGSTVTGAYSAAGYEVLLDGRPVYAAGSNPHDSALPAAPGRGLPVATIAAYCERTCRDIAAERGAAFGGVESED